MLPDSKSENKEMPTKNRRVLRVEKEIREIVGLHLINGFHGELDGIVTVSRVSATSDLRNARVNVSVIGAQDPEATVETLNEHAYEIQREIAHSLPLRYCPRVKFFLDKSLDKVMKVERILFDLNQARK